jgi:hypothetical protein
MESFYLVRRIVLSVLDMNCLRLCWNMRGCQPWVLAKGMACGLAAGQLWDSRVVLRDMSMHHGVLSRCFMKNLSIQACAIGGLFFLSSRSS